MPLLGSLSRVGVSADGNGLIGIRYLGLHLNSGCWVPSFSIWCQSFSLSTWSLMQEPALLHGSSGLPGTWTSSSTCILLAEASHRPSPDLRGRKHTGHEYQETWVIGATNVTLPLSQMDMNSNPGFLAC